MRGDEAFGGGDERGDRRLHVGGAARIELTVANSRLERVGQPLIERAGRHHVGMAGETDQRRSAALARPQIVDAVVVVALDAEAERLQARGNEVVAARVIRGQ